jgi:outer membrane protein assembly factor BamB
MASGITQKGFLALLFVLSSALAAAAQDWPQWRGPNRDGVIPSFSAPRSWPPSLVPVWRVPVGIGHSSPVVVGQRVYLLSRQEEDEVVSCISLETGRLIWRDRYPVSYKMNHAAVSHGKGPKSTPVVSGARLYTFGITGVLSCYDTGSGATVWRKDYSKEYRLTSPLYGTAMSPIVHKGLVITHVGGNDAGAMKAFDAQTGEVKWSWDGDGPGYSSPIILEAGGAEQLVTQTQKLLVGLSVTTGELLWSIPFQTAFTQNIVTPLVYKDTLIFSGIDKGTFALRLARRGGKWEATEVWKNPDVSLYMSSPVARGDYLYGLSHKRKGQFFCLDARTGQTVWTSEGREGENAGVLLAGEMLFILDDGAELTIVRADPAKLEVLKKYTVAQSPTWAHPVIVRNRILIKDQTHLVLLGLD